ncbi:vtc domain-containing [Trichoderma arundinaceum]|uniref:Vtc domain-containing n=1 Tax=Trichoderma arundinaceum TaxID=490622 RepID=A0A395NJQ9_TRIAR|nr:vtc domain-containing [Trichoderma arundinaceum]
MEQKKEKSRFWGGLLRGESLMRRGSRVVRKYQDLLLRGEAREEADAEWEEDNEDKEFQQQQQQQQLDNEQQEKQRRRLSEGSNSLVVSRRELGLHPRRRRTIDGGSGSGSDIHRRSPRTSATRRRADESLSGRLQASFGKKRDSGSDFNNDNSVNNISATTTDRNKKPPVAQTTDGGETARWPPMALSSAQELPHRDALELIARGAPTYKGRKKSIPYASDQHYVLYVTSSKSRKGGTDVAKPHDAMSHLMTMKIQAHGHVSYPWETIEQPSYAFFYGRLGGTITLNQWAAAASNIPSKIALRDSGVIPRPVSLEQIFARLKDLQQLGLEDDDLSLLYRSLYKRFLRDPDKLLSPHKTLDKQIADLIMALSRPDWIDYTEPKNQVVTRFIFDGATEESREQYHKFFHQLLLSLELELRIQSRHHDDWAKEKLLQQMPPTIKWNLALARRWRENVRVEAYGDLPQEVKLRYKLKKRQVKQLKKFAQIMKWPNLRETMDNLRQKDEEFALDSISSDAFAYFSGLVLPGQKMTREDVETMSTRSDALGPRADAYPVREYKLPALDSTRYMVDAVRMELLSFKPVAATGRESNVMGPRFFDAQVQFAIDGVSWPLRLMYDVSFISAWPCADGPHPLFYDYVYELVKADDIIKVRNWGGLYGADGQNSGPSSTASSPSPAADAAKAVVDRDVDDEKVLVVDAVGVRDNEVLARAWCAHWGFSAVVADVHKTCLACAIREAYAATLTVVILVEDQPHNDD